MDDRPITVAQRAFQEHAETLERMDNRERFSYIFQTNLWAAESVSGPGSVAEQTRELRAALPGLLARHGVRTLLDLPCGDFGWLSGADLGVERYLGGDIVPELVDRNAVRFGHDPAREFRVLDLTGPDPLPRADLVLCRDCLVHFGYHDIRRALDNLRRSGSAYLLTTTFPGTTANTDISTGDWRPLNLCREPFGFPEPLELLFEGCTEENGAFTDKALGLWRIEDLPGTSR